MAIRLINADDAEDMRILAAEAFRADGRIDLVASARDGVEIVILAEEHQPDVVLLDIDMPGRTGLEALPLVQAAAPDARVIMLSGYSRDEMAERAMSGGAVGYLEKGLSPKRLIEDIIAMSGALAAVGEAIAAASIAAQPLGAREARAFVADALAEHTDTSALDTVKLLVTELVTNSIQHAQSAADIRVLLGRDLLRVEVADDDPRMPMRRVAGVEDTSGRGIEMLEALAARWGSEPRGAGKVVWFELPRADLA
jgi:DNA-binding NarL/FixJ family response regulator